MSGCMGGGKIHDALRSLPRLLIQPDDLMNSKQEAHQKQTKKQQNTSFLILLCVRNENGKLSGEES